MIVLGPKGASRPPFVLVCLDFEGNFAEGENLEVILAVTAAAASPPEGEILFLLAADIDELPARKEFLSGRERTYRIRWVPRTDQATSYEQRAGKMVRSVAVIASYPWQGRTVRSSVSGRVEIKLDTTCLRRRLYSRLDSIMGMIPASLR